MADPILNEAIAARIRPFALRAMRREFELSGLAALEDNGADLACMACDVATQQYLVGALPPVNPISRREFEEAAAAIYAPKLDGMGEMSGWFKKLRKKVSKVGKKIEDGAKKVAKKVEDVHKKVFRKAIVPVTAPTIARKLDQRDKYKSEAAKHYAKWIASGKTDEAAHQAYLNAKGMADKRLRTVQKHVRTAATVAAAFAVAPVVAEKAGAIMSQPVTETVKQVAIDTAKDQAVDYVAEKAGEAYADHLTDKALKQLTAEQKAAAEQYAETSEAMATDEEQPNAAAPATDWKAFVLPALAVGAALLA